ncbi:MAG: hypothetical protein AAF614_10315 [Chloroflexota bacterium]
MKERPGCVSLLSVFYTGGGLSIILSLLVGIDILLLPTTVAFAILAFMTGAGLWWMTWWGWVLAILFHIWAIFNSWGELPAFIIMMLQNGLVIYWLARHRQLFLQK